MNTPPIRVLELSCGATLLVEPATNGRSAALSWMVPVGTATDPPGCEGDSVLLALMSAVSEALGRPVTA